MIGSTYGAYAAGTSPFIRSPVGVKLVFGPYPGSTIFVGMPGYESS